MKMVFIQESIIPQTLLWNRQRDRLQKPVCCCVSACTWFRCAHVLWWGKINHGTNKTMIHQNQGVGCAMMMDADAPNQLKTHGPHWQVLWEREPRQAFAKTSNESDVETEGWKSQRTEQRSNLGEASRHGTCARGFAGGRRCLYLESLNIDTNNF